MINTKITTWADFIAANEEERKLFILTCRLKGMANKEILLSLGEEYNERSRNKMRKHCAALGISSPRTGRGKGEASRDNYLKNTTLCWRCLNCYGGCNWSKSFQPVEGWKAKIINKSRYGYGCLVNAPDYFVIECPEFVQDVKFINDRGDLDD